MATQDIARVGDTTGALAVAPPVTAPPAVVAVVVLHDAGPWLEEALAGLAAQDYPNLSVLLVDAASSDDSLRRARAVLPGAYVRRLDDNPGFGGAANAVLDAVEGAAFYVFLHDDLRLEVSALRLLVEEAIRSNAGVVGPKLVDWDRPDELLQVGLAVDRAGAPSPLVERGELDQSQHDAVRDVFAVPGGCTVVRSDLFKALGGFDTAISLLGEDVDLCWRAQVAGARVLIVPAARARHREALAERKGRSDRRHLLTRHRLRSVLSCYGFVHLVRVLPQAVIATVGEAVYAVLSGRPRLARDLVGAWAWNLRRIGDLRERRHTLRSLRRLPDRELRRLQLSGSARLRALVQGERSRAQVRSSLGDVGRELTGSLRTGERRLALLTWSVVALLALAGSRQLITDGVPAVAGFAPFDSGPIELLREYSRGWRTAGFGSAAPAPTAYALLGLAGLGLAGAMSLLRLLLVVGCLPLGLLGAWRLAGPLVDGSARPRLVAVVVYATVALPYRALAEGSWAGLLLYAAAPWLLVRLAAATAEPPFVARSGPAWVREAIGLALLVALVGAFVPAVVLLVPGAALAVAVGSLVTGGVRGGLRALSVAIAAAAGATALHLPWSLGLGEWWLLGGVGAVGPTEVEGGPGALLRFVTGPGPLTALGWSIFAAAALALLIGRDWRLRWAGRAWSLALSSWALAEVANRDLLPVPLPSADVLTAMGAAALTLSAAMGMAAFQCDLRNYRFGWRQVVSLVAALAAVVGISPVLVRAVDGRWDAPGSDFDRTLAFLDRSEVSADGTFRVLWVGDPDVLPLAGLPLEGDLAYATSTDGAPEIVGRWAAPPSVDADRVADALRTAAAGDTERLGRLLAPVGVRYLALPSRSAPERTGAPSEPLPQGLLDGLAQQLDLSRVEIDPALDLYENVAWVSGQDQAVDPGTRRPSTSAWRWALMGLQVLGWCSAATLVWRGRMRRLGRGWLAQ